MNLDKQRPLKGFCRVAPLSQACNKIHMDGQCLAWPTLDEFRTCTAWGAFFPIYSEIIILSALKTTPHYVLSSFRGGCTINHKWISYIFIALTFKMWCCFQGWQTNDFTVDREKMHPKPCMHVKNSLLGLGQEEHWPSYLNGLLNIFYPVSEMSAPCLNHKWIYQPHN